MAKVFVAMAGVVGFLKAHQRKFWSWEQLANITECFGLVLKDKRTKESIKSILKANLFEDSLQSHVTSCWVRY